MKQERVLTLSAMAATLLVVMSFGYAFFQVDYPVGVPLIFTIAMILLGVSVVDLFREVQISQDEFRDE